MHSTPSWFGSGQGRRVLNCCCASTTSTSQGLNPSISTIYSRQWTGSESIGMKVPVPSANSSIHGRNVTERIPIGRLPLHWLTPVLHICVVAHARLGQTVVMTPASAQQASMIPQNTWFDYGNYPNGSTMWIYGWAHNLCPLSGRHRLEYYFAETEYHLTN